MNIVVLQGTVREEPLTHTLASGKDALSFELSVCAPTGEATRVPVVVINARVDVRLDDELVVIGGVRKRFFRVASATQSRTEVVAAKVVPVRRRAQVQRALEQAIEAISTGE
jgi:hypothetical protein